MPWNGSCNGCGHCGCFEGAGGPAKWYPGVGVWAMKWGRMYPGRDLDICQLIRTAYLAKYGYEWDHDFNSNVTIRIVGGGAPINVDCYITERGIQKSATDASCPFFQTSCVLYGRTQLPPSCANAPQLITDPYFIANWEINHPHTSQGGLCGYYWTD